MQPRNKFKINCILPLLLSAAFLLGCERGNNDAYSSYIPDDRMPEKNSSFTVEELTGEALIRSDGAQVDERTRIAALLDALRKLAVKVDSPASIDLKSSEILEKSGAVWDGLEVSSEIIRKKGVVISDEIRVILHDKDMKPVNSWRTRNMKLIEPAEDREAGLSILMAAMQARGFKFESNHRLEENIWQEVIRYSKFDNK